VNVGRGSRVGGVEEGECGEGLHVAAPPSPRPNSHNALLPAPPCPTTQHPSHTPKATPAPKLIHPPMRIKEN
jgi:hypothetical protein